MADKGRVSRPTRTQRRVRTLLTLEEQLSCVVSPAKICPGGPATVGSEGAVCVCVCVVCVGVGGEGVI